MSAIKSAHHGKLKDELQPQEADSPNETLRTLREQRQRFLDDERNSQADFDKLLTGLSGAALGLSVTFIKDIVGQRPVQEKELLLIGWICLGFSLTYSLLSFRSSNSAFRHGLDNIDEEIAHVNDANWSNKKRITPAKLQNFFDKLTSGFNTVALIAFLVGTAAVTLFAWLNLG